MSKLEFNLAKKCRYELDKGEPNELGLERFVRNTKISFKIKPWTFISIVIE